MKLFNTITILSLGLVVNANPLYLNVGSIFGSLRRNNNFNDVVLGKCKPFTLIFARGTAELTGNIGWMVGPYFAQALKKALPGGEDALAIQGITYSAGIPGYFDDGDPKGAKKMIELVEKACPETAIILSGYR
ncbi:hypothetical protein TWF694_005383 [Orbilia ellipsospora]|uniref:cutinase n=1 Tax=Orbilia ellipsospora TaxID=2528407 RepID=A0AAV9WVF0_9PEZI